MDHVIESTPLSDPSPRRESPWWNDPVGKRFAGRVVVRAVSDTRWIVRCDECGAERTLGISALKHGNGCAFCAQRARPDRERGRKSPSSASRPAPGRQRPRASKVLSVRDLAREAREARAIRKLRHLPIVPSTPTRVPLPATRGECAGGHRPCPMVSCRYHLAIDVRPNGSLVMNFEVNEKTEVPTCALDVADAGGATLEEIGTTLGIVRERIRQIEVAALSRAGRAMKRDGVDIDHVAEQRPSPWDEMGAGG